MASSRSPKSVIWASKAGTSIIASWFRPRGSVPECWQRAGAGSELSAGRGTAVRARLGRPARTFTTDSTFLSTPSSVTSSAGTWDRCAAARSAASRPRG